jgi:hypothetical protein
MRTTVYTDRTNPDATDEFPGCFATVDAPDRRLSVVQFPDCGVEAQYEPGGWHTYEVTDDEEV